MRNEFVIIKRYPFVVLKWEGAIRECFFVEPAQLGRQSILIIAGWFSEFGRWFIKIFSISHLIPWSKNETGICNSCKSWKVGGMNYCFNSLKIIFYRNSDISNVISDSVNVAHNRYVFIDFSFHKLRTSDSSWIDFF